jgi:MFS family permease
VTTWTGAVLSDRVGRIKVYAVGYILAILWVYPMFVLVQQGTLVAVAIALIGVTIPQGLTYGPQSALFAEMFPARIRLSGASLAYAIGAILGGAFSPTIAEFLSQQSGTVVSVAFYLGVMSIISLATVLTIKDRSQEPLHSISGH